MRRRRGGGDGAAASAQRGQQRVPSLFPLLCLPSRSHQPALFFAATNIAEITRQGMIIQAEHKFPENIVQVSYAPDKFFFVVETSGALHPSDILDYALQALLNKLRAASEAVRQLS